MKKAILSLLIFSSLVFLGSGELFSQESAPVLAQSSSTQNEVGAKKLARVKELLKLMRIEEQNRMIFFAQLENLKTQVALSDEQYNEIIADLDFSPLLDVVAPVYAKRLSEEQIEALITFYNSKLGKDFVAAQMEIAIETMTVTEPWALELQKKIMERVQEVMSK